MGGKNQTLAMGQRLPFIPLPPITPALLGLSIGIENRNDLKRDLEKALIS